MILKISTIKKYNNTNPSGKFTQKIEGYCKEDEIIRNLNTFLPSALNFLEVEKKLKIKEKDLQELNRILKSKALASIEIINQCEKSWNYQPKTFLKYYNIKVEKIGD